ncbi:RDD family protein [Effusibacillus consociatus]|uniref:RDD family protein n=1 Tax=Effusibacillus consociatus TaxID=1117041 RepID=A0ABV9Q7A5_9BACL
MKEGGYMFCQKCGTKNADDANFCQSCGTPMQKLTQSITTPKNKYAGFWVRVGAMLLDSIILAPIAFILGLIFGFLEPQEGPADAILQLIVIAGTWLYVALMESSSIQGTLGKKLVGIKVTDIHGNRISFLRATGRHFSKLLSYMIFFIGFFMAGFTEKKQALHDMIAGCLVVKKPTEVIINSSEGSPLYE